jgi:hypothetical protein
MSELRGTFRTFVAFLLFQNFVSAQLLGCGDGINCPQDRCIVGNTSNTILGVTSFESKISPDRPLTWAVGSSATQSRTNLTEDLFVKSFYLGTPPTLQLTKTTAFAGCALFFEGIAKNLPLNYTTEFNTVTCNEVLQAGCVNDLLSQATQEVQILASSSSATNSSLCEALQSALQTLPPISCPPAVGGSWGTVVAREITGHNAPDPVNLSTCHPSTGGDDYRIALIETQSLTAYPNSTDSLMSYIYGITPVLTVFYNQGGESALLRKPEAHLSCMKVVDRGAAVPFSGDADRCRLHSKTCALILALAGAVMLL